MEIRYLTKDEIHEIEKLSSEAENLLNSDIKSDSSLLDKIYEFINNLKENESNTENTSSLTFQLGSLYGKIIQDEYNWEWIFLKDNDNSAYGVASQDGRFSCQIYAYLFKIITTSKANNTRLLFNMLSDLNHIKSNENQYLFLE